MSRPNPYEKQYFHQNRGGILLRRSLPGHLWHIHQLLFFRSADREAECRTVEGGDSISAACSYLKIPKLLLNKYQTVQT